MKGETSLQSSIIGVMAAASMFIGFGAYFTGLMGTNNQTVSPTFDYASTFNTTYTQVENITSVFRQVDPSQNPYTIFDLTTIYIYQFANILYNIPGVMAGMINNIVSQLGQFGIASWFVGFIVAAIGIYMTFKVASIIFRRGGDT